MSVLDRIHRTSTETGEPDQTSQEQSSTLILAEPPVVRRLRIVMTQLSQFAGRNQGSKYSRYAWVLQSMMDEILDELADIDSVTMGKWFVDFGKIVEWCGSGDETVLPDSVRAYLAENHPQELVAIEA